jgi:hypothetical protein
VTGVTGGGSRLAGGLDGAWLIATSEDPPIKASVPTINLSSNKETLLRHINHRLFNFSCYKKFNDSKASNCLS